VGFHYYAQTLHSVITRGGFFLYRYGACHSKHKTDPSIVRILQAGFLPLHGGANNGIATSIRRLNFPHPDRRSGSNSPYVVRSGYPNNPHQHHYYPNLHLPKTYRDTQDPNAIILLTPKPTSPDLATHMRTLLANAGAER